jgi:hypothetical protein
VSQDFINALRAVLDLDPLYGGGAYREDARRFGVGFYPEPWFEKQRRKMRVGLTVPGRTEERDRSE